MNIRNLISDFTDSNSADKQNANPVSSLASMIPGGLAGGAAAGGLMALFMGSKSTRKMAKKVVKFGGTAVLGGLAYKAYGNWQKNKALGQTRAINDADISQAQNQLGSPVTAEPLNDNTTPLALVLVKAMIAASKADGDFDSQEQGKLFSAVEKLGLSMEEKALVFDLMTSDIRIQEIADQVTLDEHKAEVYLAAYLAIDVDHQAERAFLNNLAIALDLPKGFPAYLEQQADQGFDVVA